MTITEPALFEAVRTGLVTIATIRALFPNAFEWVKSGERYWIDVLLGTDRVRLALDRGIDVSEILRDERRELKRFVPRREAHLLY